MRGACAAIGATCLQAQFETFELTLAKTADARTLEPRARQLHQGLVVLARQLEAELER